MVRILLCLLLMIYAGTVSAQIFARDIQASGYVNPSDSANVTGKAPVSSRSLLRSAVAPLSLVTAGIIVETVPSHTVFSKERIQEHVLGKMNGFETSADNYLQFVPLAAMFGLKLAGMKSRSDLLNQAIITVKSELLVSAIVYSMKHVIRDMRPDGSSDDSMPSGHTVQAFVSATLLDMEYRDTSPWISVGGYLCAGATGFLRVANNRHWASDVLIGAGIGIASVRLVCLTHRYRWGKMPSAVLVPVLYERGGGVAFAIKL
ncbi:MAG TPA: phosphatase PAP2 family protein [Prolixibacteraceae bacterium]|nr:phosphatase PAP2 family protein [Prolixibacteraceae bacterium]